MLAFLEAIRRGGDPAQAHIALLSLELRLRMHALHTAVVMPGRDAPAQWRADASRGLSLASAATGSACSKVVSLAWRAATGW